MDEKMSGWRNSQPGSNEFVGASQAKLPCVLRAHLSQRSG